MLGKPVPETIFSGYRIATMAGADVELRCEFSGELLWGATGKPKACAPSPYGIVENVSVGVAGGKILWLARDDSMPDFPDSVCRIEGDGKLLAPGLIDCHTHLVYGGNRANEWEKRLNGQSYESISREGGGILSTVRATRAASEEQLFESASWRMKQLISDGVTTVEIKSGYGLDLENELKMLRVARALENRFPVSIETTLLAAHALPPEFKNRAGDYIRLVCDEIIPAAVGLCTSVDVFCESIAFDLSQTREVFEAALEAGLNIKIHAEQLSHMGSAILAAEMGAISADHLEYLDPDTECERLAHFGTVATLLPGAFYCLNETKKPPVESLRLHGVPIAIATDSNPGSSPVVSILLVANMACNLFGMTPEESFAGITRNAARALRLDHQIGTIEPGKMADFSVWQCQSPAEIIYGLGGSPCVESYKHGSVV